MGKDYLTTLEEALLGYEDIPTDEWFLMQEACRTGDLAMLVETMGKMDADFWSGITGRKGLRLLTSLASVEQVKSIVSYLILERNVPLNSVSKEELDFDKDDPRQQYCNVNSTPFLASILVHHEDFAFFVLSATRRGLGFEPGGRHRELQHFASRCRGRPGAVARDPASATGSPRRWL